MVRGEAARQWQKVRQSQDLVACRCPGLLPVPSPRGTSDRLEQSRSAVAHALEERSARPISEGLFGQLSATYWRVTLILARRIERLGRVATRANVYDDSGALMIKHFAGPTWQYKDGSKAVGRAQASITVDATAIPWLRLAASSTEAGPGGDRLAHTTYVQRIATTGGLAPAAAECNAATAGTMAEVPYTADYYFWKQTAA